jgi:hypothetical protein
MGDESDPVTPKVDRAEPKEETPPPTPSRFAYVTYGVMRLCQIDCTADEVRDGRYPPRPVQPFDRSKATDEGSKEGLALAIYLDQGEHARRITVQDKARWLFTLAAAVLTLFSGMLVRRPTWFGLLGVVLVALPLLLTTLMLLRFFGTETRSTALIDSSLIEAAGSSVHLEALERHSRATAFNAGATDFLVDLYRASHRLTTFALCGVVVVSVATMLAPTSNTLVEEVRGNPDLIRLLRGPEGPEGKQGDVGAVGPAGPQGPSGAIGRCSCPPVDGGW